MDARILLQHRIVAEDLDATADARSRKELVVTVKGCRAHHVAAGQQLSIVEGCIDLQARI